MQFKITDKLQTQETHYDAFIYAWLGLNFDKLHQGLFIAIWPSQAFTDDLDYWTSVPPAQGIIASSGLW